MALRKILDRGDPTPSAYEAARQRWADARTEVRELTERLEDAKAAMRLHGYDAVRGERLTLAPLRERATRFLAGRHLSERQIRRAVEDLEDLLAAALARLRTAQEDHQRERDLAAMALAKQLQPRHKAAVRKLAAAIEVLSAATAEERTIRGELMASGLAPTGSLLLPDASSMLQLGTLDEFSSKASEWGRTMRRLGVLDG